MNISNFPPSELEFFREKCGFSGEELLVFELRSRDLSIDDIADILNTDVSKARDLNREVERKMACIF